MKFEFATAGRILFGSGGFGQLPSLAQGLGDAALLVLGIAIVVLTRRRRRA